MAVKKNFSSFSELLNSSNLPVLVDFYATWCGPCQMMAPILEQVGAQLKNKVKVVKIDTDKYPNLGSQYEIQALPTLILFVGGMAVEKIEGLRSATEIISILNRRI
ncbi:MAG: thioredoxin [Cyanobacteriota bacterium ELA615]